MGIPREGMGDEDRVRVVWIEGTSGLVGHLYIREREPRFGGEANLQIPADGLQVCQPHQQTRQARRHGARNPQREHLQSRGHDMPAPPPKINASGRFTISPPG
jgi:hypothetical protein